MSGCNPNSSSSDTYTKPIQSASTTPALGSLILSKLKISNRGIVGTTAKSAALWPMELVNLDFGTLNFGIK